MDGAGNVLRRYVHGPGTDRPVAMVEGSAGSGFSHSYYHADHLGSIVALTDDSGGAIAHYNYDAYGVPYLVDPVTGARTQVAAGQPYLFTGRRFDFETGLYYYRARYYSASLGRFLQTDPVGYEDQMNLYAYVSNDPVNGADPSGMKGCLVAMKVSTLPLRCSGPMQANGGGGKGKSKANGDATPDLNSLSESELKARTEHIMEGENGFTERQQAVDDWVRRIVKLLKLAKGLYPYEFGTIFYKYLQGGKTRHGYGTTVTQRHPSMVILGLVEFPNEILELDSFEPIGDIHYQGPGGKLGFSNHADIWLGWQRFKRTGIRHGHLLDRDGCLKYHDYSSRPSLSAYLKRDELKGGGGTTPGVVLSCGHF